MLNHVMYYIVAFNRINFLFFTYFMRNAPLFSSLNKTKYPLKTNFVLTYNFHRKYSNKKVYLVC